MPGNASQKSDLETSASLNYVVSDQELVDLVEFKRNPILRFYKYIGTRGAEWNYIGGIPLNYDMDFTTSISPSAQLAIILGWNYLDGIYSVGLGILQLLDEEDYRQRQNKIKGVLNIISGVELFLLSYNPVLTGALGLTGGTALAAPAFALGMALDLVTAAIDFYNAHKEVTFEGWLEERAQEISYNHHRILKLSKKLETLDTTDNDNLLKSKYLMAKIKTLNNKNDNLQKDVYARSRVYCQVNLSNDTYEDRKKTVEIILSTYLPASKYNRIAQELNKSVSNIDLEKDKHIQKELSKNYKENCIKLSIKSASFVGMTLLAVSGFVSCPPLLIAGLAITTAVAVYYGYRNGEYLMRGCYNKATKLGFFSEKGKEAANSTTKPTIEINNLTPGNAHPQPA